MFTVSDVSKASLSSVEWSNDIFYKEQKKKNYKNFLTKKKTIFESKTIFKSSWLFWQMLISQSFRKIIKAGGFFKERERFFLVFFFFLSYISYFSFFGTDHIALLHKYAYKNPSGKDYEKKRD